MKLHPYYKMFFINIITSLSFLNAQEYNQTGHAYILPLQYRKQLAFSLGLLQPINRLL